MKKILSLSMIVTMMTVVVAWSSTNNQKETVSSVNLGVGHASVAAAMLDKARTAWRGQDWQSLVDALTPMAEENPYNGRFWYGLGTAHYNLKNYQQSVHAYEKSIELGYEVGGCFYNIGCDYALMGNTEKAVAALERAIESGLRQRDQLLREDSDLDSIRESRLFQQNILPTISENTSRVNGWRADLEYLTARMEKTHYDVYRNVSRDEWSRSIKRISRDIPKLADHEIIVALMKLMVKVGDGHTGVRTPVHGERAFHAIPVELFSFKDGLFVLGAVPGYRDAVGGRVVKVGKLPVEEALARVAEVTQRDNAMQVKWLAANRLTIMEILDALDISEGLDYVDYDIADENGKVETVRFESVPISQTMFGRQWKGLTTMRDQAESPLPLWQKDMGSNYWFEYLPDERLVYFQYNSVRNQEGSESIADFSERMFAFIEENDVDALVIDVRLNHGGNNFLNQPIIHGIIRSTKINERGRLFTITGRATFSACQNFVNRLENNADVIFVGEPTGSKRNFVGEGNSIQLPYSGVIANGSSRYWQDGLSEDRRQWVAPELIAEMTSTDFRTNHDPAMETIRAYLANRRLAGSEGASR